jgi:polysaccharide export outer membrane protein
MIRTRSLIKPRWNLIWIFLPGLWLAYFAFILPSSIALSSQEQAVLPAVEYKIGPNDLLDIKVFEQPELNQTTRVSEDGTIALALLGKVHAAGMTVFELEKKIASLLEDKWLKTAHVTVFVQEYQRIAVIGAVRNPGLYELIGQVNLLGIISQAGGLTELAMDEIYIQREEANGVKNRITINLEDLIRRGNQDLNIILQPRDQIIIPTDEIINVYVTGEVKTPGAVQFKRSKKPTLMQAIAQAGGTTEWAKKSNVLVRRTDKITGKEIKLTINLKNIMKGKISDPLLEEGDVIIVP